MRLFRYDYAMSRCNSGENGSPHVKRSVIVHRSSSTDSDGKVSNSAAPLNQTAQTNRQLMYSLIRPSLFRVSAELAHHLTLIGLNAAHATGALALLAEKPVPLPTSAFGVRFANPVGIAAGLDKNGEAIDSLLALGCGFVEVGTVTPRAQAGNPKPRIFRLTDQAALINRAGFNTDGVDAVVRNVSRAQRRHGRVGINIGKNKETPNAQADKDYLYCLERVYPVADFVTLNLSSPNTEGLRALQEVAALDRLVAILRDKQEQLAARHHIRVPMLVKLAPDLDDSQIAAIAKVLTERQIDGVIATNTTIQRPAGVANHPEARQTGGLSGAPLLAASTHVLAQLRAHLPATIPLIGVGGIQSGADAIAKISAGATLVQCYTGLVYQGPRLIYDCVEALRFHRQATPQRA